MHKLICVILCLISLNSIAQDKSDKELLDSLIKNDDMMKLLSQLDEPTSYFKINIAVGNELFSQNDKALNALESNNKLIFNPTFGYTHKSGFALTFGAYLLNENSATKFYQYAVTPSYDYQKGKTVAAGISYSRFFSTEKYGSASPIQNDLYSYVHLKKPIIQPGIAIGYSSGEYKEIDTVTVVLPVLGQKTFADTADSKIKSFELIGTLQHSFNFTNVLNNKDALTFTPTFMMNTGSSKYDVTHHNKFGQRIKNKRAKLLRIQSDKIDYTLQSFGLNMDLSYEIGKFSFEPQLYLDYYVAKTDLKRFTQVYSINVAFSF